MARRPHVRFLIERDILAALAIDGFTSLPTIFEGDFVRYIRKRHSYRALAIADHKNRLESYLILKIDRDGVYADRMAAHPDFGEELAWSFYLRDLQEAVRSDQIKRIVLQVEEHELEQQLFFQQHGFLATANIREASESNTDIIVLEFGKDLVQHMA